MDENLVGYLCNALDADTQMAVEHYLRDNTEAQRRLELLRRALEPLAADRDDPPPPAGLVFRTLGRVAEHSCRKLPQAPVFAGRVGHQRSWWRRADVLIAAVLLLAIFGVGLSGLHRYQDYRGRVECGNNLHGFYRHLVNYSNRNDGRFPSVADHPTPYNVAGIVVPVLMENQGADVPSIRCPSNGPHRACSWSLQELKALDAEEFNRRASSLAGCYAYTLGYQDQAGNIHGLRHGEHDHLPLMGDRGPGPGQMGNSPNHRGMGQNVLHAGGNVRFYRERLVNGDDLYLNHQGKVAAGVNAGDAVLGASADRPN